MNKLNERTYSIHDDKDIDTGFNIAPAILELLLIFNKVFSTIPSPS